MASSASKGVRVAAGIVCAVFVPFVLIHLLWATGNTWGLKAVSGDQLRGGLEHASTGLTVVSLFGAAAGVAVIIVTISRVGWLKTPLSDRLLHLGNWLVFAWPAIGILNPLSTWDSGRSACRWRSPRSSSHGRTCGRARTERNGLTHTHTARSLRAQEPHAFRWAFLSQFASWKSYRLFRGRGSRGRGGDGVILRISVR
jgi:hypothetical protein